MTIFSILHETLFRCFLRWFIDNRHNGHEAGDAVTMPLHLGSTLATLFVALFSSSFEFLPPSVRALGCRWWMNPGESPGQKGVEGGKGGGKKISRPMRELFEDEGSWCSGVWKKKRQTRRWLRRTGRKVCRRRRAFRMIDRTGYIPAMADHR